MKALTRALVFALALVTSGVFQSLACEATAEVGCAESESEEAGCADCEMDCGICIVCPLSVAPPSALDAPLATTRVLSPLAAPLPEQPANAHSREIFQPPRA